MLCLHLVVMTSHVSLSTSRPHLGSSSYMCPEPELPWLLPSFLLMDSPSLILGSHILYFLFFPCLSKPALRKSSNLHTLENKLQVRLCVLPIPEVYAFN